MIQQIAPTTPWQINRLGKFTSSKIDDLLTEPNSKEAKERGELSVAANTYIKSKAAEIITGTIREVTGYPMEWGKKYEPEAAAFLTAIFPNMKYMGKESPVFFPYSDFSGGSPDGVDVVGKMIFEIKCPEDPAKHVEYCLLQNGRELKKAERDYYHQIQMNMLCVANQYGFSFDAMKGLFASYHPLVNAPYMSIKQLIIEPDFEFSDKIDGIIERAETQLASVVKALRQSSVLIAHYENSQAATP